MDIRFSYKPPFIVRIECLYHTIPNKRPSLTQNQRNGSSSGNADNITNLHGCRSDAHISASGQEVPSTIADSHHSSMEKRRPRVFFYLIQLLFSKVFRNLHPLCPI